MTLAQRTHWDEARHAAALARCVAATEGPWIAFEGDAREDNCERPQYNGRLVAVTGERGALGYGPRDIRDSHFIAYSRTDLPDALAEIVRLREALYPFARFAQACNPRPDAIFLGGWDGVGIDSRVTGKHLHAARAAIREGQEPSEKPRSAT